jgi:hypothetical protein
LKIKLIIEKCGFDFGHHLNDQDFWLELVTIWQPKSNPESKRKKKLKKIWLSKNVDLISDAILMAKIFITINHSSTI